MIWERRFHTTNLLVDSMLFNFFVAYIGQSYSFLPQFFFTFRNRTSFTSLPFQSSLKNFRPVPVVYCIVFQNEGGAVWRMFYAGLISIYSDCEPYIVPFIQFRIRR
jgi:hypothetical protein